MPAQAFDQNEVLIPNVTFTWSTSDSTIAKVTTKGRITAIANGSATIRAVVGADTATLPVTVQQKLAQFVMNPALPLTMDAFGEDSLVTATAHDSLGSVITGTGGAPVWGLQSVGIVTVDATGHVQSVGNGTTYVYASQSPIRDSLQVIVAQRAARIVVSAPNGLAISAIGGTLVLTTASFDRNNNPIANAVPTLVSLDPTIAQVNSPTRTVTGIAQGAARIVANEDLTADTVLVQVANLPVKLSLSVDSAIMNSVGDTLKLGVTFTNSLGGTVTGLVPSWYSSDTTILSVATQDGRVVAVRQGTARIIASYASLSDTALITVTNGRPRSTSSTAPTRCRRSGTRSSSTPRSSIPGGGVAPADLRDLVHQCTGSGGRLDGRDSDGAIDRPDHGPRHERHPVRLGGALGHQCPAAHRAQLASRHLDGARAAAGLHGGRHQSERPDDRRRHDHLVEHVLVSRQRELGRSGDGAGCGHDRHHRQSRHRRRHGHHRGAHADPALRGQQHPRHAVLRHAQAAVRAHPGCGLPAAPEDTVFVKVGVGPYSESVALSRDIVLMGDPTAYRAAGNNPTKLPLISHDTGATAISAITSARVIVRTLAIRHTLDGSALYAHGASIALSNVFVNPSGDPFNSGRGLWIDSTSNASVDSCTVQNVKAFGIKLRNVSNGSLTRSNVYTVAVAEAAHVIGRGRAGLRLERSPLGEPRPLDLWP